MYRTDARRGGLGKICASGWEKFGSEDFEKHAGRSYCSQVTYPTSLFILKSEHFRHIPDSSSSHLPAPLAGPPILAWSDASSHQWWWSNIFSRSTRVSGCAEVASPALRSGKVRWVRRVGGRPWASGRKSGAPASCLRRADVDRDPVRLRSLMQSRRGVCVLGAVSFPSRLPCSSRDPSRPSCDAVPGLFRSSPALPV